MFSSSSFIFFCRFLHCVKFEIGSHLFFFIIITFLWLLIAMMMMKKTVVIVVVAMIDIIIIIIIVMTVVGYNYNTTENLSTICGPEKALS